MLIFKFNKKSFFLDNSTHIVLIHDAVRPLVDVDLVESLIENAVNFGVIMVKVVVFFYFENFKKFKNFKSKIHRHLDQFAIYHQQF